MDNDQQRDLDVLTHAALAFGVAITAAGALLFAVPALFNLHSSEADVSAVALIFGTIACAHLSGRHLWRSFQSLTPGEDE